MTKSLVILDNSKEMFMLISYGDIFFLRNVSIGSVVPIARDRWVPAILLLVSLKTQPVWAFGCPIENPLIIFALYMNFSI